MARIHILIFFSLFLFSKNTRIWAQENDSLLYGQKIKETEVKFLYSYYEQDGEHSPVLGGTGTEYLTDHVGKIIVNMPTKNGSLSFSGGIDHYTSASTDNINPASVSSASVVDDRIYFSANYSKENKKNGVDMGINLGYSTEWDVTSYSGGIFLAKTFNEENSQVSFNFQHFSDKWELIFPVELRSQLPDDSTDWRHIYDWSILYSQIISRKIQASVSAGVILQKGYLSTPFHRVYFKDGFFPKIEHLPGTRWKLPFGFRLNYYMSDYLIARTYYRLYFDRFGIVGNTANVELAIKPKPFFAVAPFYRFHIQSAAKYFAEIDEHILDEKYYTSDYDLSAFHSHKFGLGIRYSPVNGIFRKKETSTQKHNIYWKKIEARGAAYFRSDGLEAYIVSLGFSFVIENVQK